MHSVKVDYRDSKQFPDRLTCSTCKHETCKQIKKI